jgi:N-acetylglucosamine malate deacetylase 1
VTDISPKTIVVIAAHPDDEVLGCGGTLARHASDGDSVHILFLADGVSSRQSVSESASEVRMESACSAAEILGARRPSTLALPDNKLDSLPLLEIVQGVESFLADKQPTIVYTHHGGDLNIDHRIAHQATMTAARPQPDTKIKTILSFETPSSTEWATPAIGLPFRPNHFVDVSDYANCKLEALKQYDAEMRPFPHARSVEAVEALMRTRGTSVGLTCAEAFICERNVLTNNN